MASTPSKTLLSYEAAQTIYDKIEGFDRVIDAEIERVKGAASTIAEAYEVAGNAYQQRKSLAEELSRLAPDDFTPSNNLGSIPMAAQPWTGRFARNHPFPQPRSHSVRGFKSDRQDYDNGMRY